MCDNGFSVSLLKNDGSLVNCDVNQKNDAEKKTTSYAMSCGPTDTFELVSEKPATFKIGTKEIDASKWYKENVGILQLKPEKLSTVKLLGEDEKPKNVSQGKVFVEVTFDEKIKVVTTDDTKKEDLVKDEQKTVYLTFDNYNSYANWSKANTKEIPDSAVVKVFVESEPKAVNEEPIAAIFENSSSVDKFLEKRNTYILKVTKEDGSVKVITAETPAKLAAKVEALESFKEVIVVSPNYGGEENKTSPEYTKFKDKESLQAFAGMQKQIGGKKLEVTKFATEKSDKEGLLKWKVYLGYVGGKEPSPNAEDPYITKIKKSPISDDMKKNLLGDAATGGEFLNLYSPVGVIVGGILDVGKYFTTGIEFLYKYAIDNDLGQGDTLHDIELKLKGGFKPSGFWSKTKAKSLEWAIDGLIGFDFLMGDVTYQMEPDPVSTDVSTFNLGLDTYVSYMFDLTKSLQIGPFIGGSVEWPVAVMSGKDPDLDPIISGFAGAMLTFKTFNEKSKAKAKKYASGTEPMVNTKPSEFNRPPEIPPEQIAKFDEVKADKGSLDVSFKNVKFKSDAPKFKNGTDPLVNKTAAMQEINLKAAELQKAIDDLAAKGLIMSGQKVVIKVYGHASPENTEQHNFELSQSRAEFLITELKKIIKKPEGVEIDYQPVPLGENNLYAIEVGAEKPNVNSADLAKKYAGDVETNIDVIIKDFKEPGESPAKGTNGDKGIANKAKTHYLIKYDSNWYLVPLAPNRYVSGKAGLEFECDTKPPENYSAASESIKVTAATKVGDGEITANTFEFDTNAASNKIAEKKSPLTVQEMAALKEVIKANSNAKQELVIFVNADPKADDAATKKLAEWFNVFAGSYTSLPVRVFVTKEDRKETGVTMMFTKGTAKIGLADETSKAMEIKKFWFDQTGSKPKDKASFDTTK